jgi:hypothetical protein
MVSARLQAGENRNVTGVHYEGGSRHTHYVPDVCSSWHGLLKIRTPATPAQENPEDKDTQTA